MKNDVVTDAEIHELALDEFVLASLFFRLVTHRYGRGATLITTNKSVRDRTELLAGDEVLATAVLDRLPHRANVLNTLGRSYC